ncbi:PIN domain-containing protein [Streptomyces hoynatensis]|uniref:Ribonuclease VapC n=1 Tax=Streptomyces hoynatensis TaxID=1141874 RepID=A0A3A9ZF33_9ACTN|nr:PIN domain-containing protein [Streptomyces hoynatensis]RKN46958.1 VapC toxin family PIN domain ribonuclease [Streptomyces hoynatensis]
MARRLILDTGILTGADRGHARLAGVLDEHDDVTIAAVSLAELQLGVELAEGQRRVRRQEFVDGVRALIPVEDYTDDVALVHARLLAHVRREGKPRGAHDLIIAATAAATARTLLTTDGKASFDDLPGVRAVVVHA